MLIKTLRPLFLLLCKASNRKAWSVWKSNRNTILKITISSFLIPWILENEQDGHMVRKNLCLLEAVPLETSNYCLQASEYVEEHLHIELASFPNIVYM